MTRIVLVPGTFHAAGDWLSRGSAFRQFVEAREFACVPFEGWSGDVDGIPLVLGENGKHSDWIAGGWALSYLLQSMPYADRNVIAHSHGGQVAAYCAARAGVPIRRLVTVCTPSRTDMRATYRAAAANVGYWRHVYAAGWDLMQRAGELFDGAIGWTRKIAEADDNCKIRGIDHSKLLNDPAWIPELEACGALDVLRGQVRPSVLRRKAA